MTECVQNGQDGNDQARNHHGTGDELSMRMVHSANAEKFQLD